MISKEGFGGLAKQRQRAHKQLIGPPQEMYSKRPVRERP